MEQFVPTKASKLVIRVKIDANPAIACPEENEKAGFGSTAVFFAAAVFFLIAVSGYFYFSNSNEEHLPPKIDAVFVEMPVNVNSAESLPANAMASVENVPVIDELSDDKDVVPAEPIAIEEPVSPPISGLSRHVSRAQFTSGIKNREPVDEIKNCVPAKKEGIGKIYFFTELKNLNNQVIRHSWFHDGKLVSEIKFNVRGNRWRVNSSKRLNLSMRGKWRVAVMNEQGDVLLSSAFNYECL